MKKLGKKLDGNHNSLTAFTCFCAYSVCSCNCPGSNWMVEAMNDVDRDQAMGPHSDEVLIQ